MSRVVPRVSDALMASPGRSVSQRTHDQVVQAGENATVLAAETLALEWVADVALGSTARVTAEELHYSREFPDYAYRFRRIGDIQAMAAARKVQGAGQ